MTTKEKLQRALEVLKQSGPSGIFAGRKVEVRLKGVE